MTKVLHAVITGRVQGVGYRAWAANRATLLGLKGWVRNRRDGSVEAVFKGNEQAIVRMLDDCWRGPRSAAVVDVVATSIADEAWPDFSVRPTA
ncbi:acylphosphatase [Taklimakanibacter lacteus]|uniref:acylphosphatase n=1 Tax=Taklimakanibacter lacteus TaxID=2268456 RepID=UPI000E6674BD